MSLTGTQQGFYGLGLRWMCGGSFSVVRGELFHDRGAGIVGSRRRCPRVARDGLRDAPFSRLIPPKQTAKRSTKSRNPPPQSRNSSRLIDSMLEPTREELHYFSPYKVHIDTETRRPCDDPYDEIAVILARLAYQLLAHVPPQSIVSAMVFRSALSPIGSFLHSLFAKAYS